MAPSGSSNGRFGRRPCRVGDPARARAATRAAAAAGRPRRGRARPRAIFGAVTQSKRPDPGWRNVFPSVEALEEPVLAWHLDGAGPVGVAEALRVAQALL